MAIAFVLLNPAPGATLPIAKNLRVWQDATRWQSLSQWLSVGELYSGIQIASMKKGSALVVTKILVTQYLLVQHYCITFSCLKKKITKRDDSFSLAIMAHSGALVNKLDFLILFNLLLSCYEKPSILQIAAARRFDLLFLCHT
ncbi:hypothetical protein ACJX0J_010483 [Zea mays]